MAHTDGVPDTAVTPSDNFSVLRMDRTAEAGKTKGGGVCFMINRKWCDPRNISILSRSCSPHLHISPLSAAHSICPGNFHQSSLLLSTFHHNLTLAWLCSISTMCSADITTNILTLPSSSPETLTKPTSRRSCRTFISIYPVQPEDWIHSIIATLRSKMPTKPTHCRLLANQIMPPFSSHRNTKKGSLMNRRWRGKWRAGPPLWSCATGVSWWRRLGHVPGEFIWRQRIHGCSNKLCKHANRASHWNGNNKDIF